jgi:hypothetical protein
MDEFASLGSASHVVFEKGVAGRRRRNRLLCLATRQSLHAIPSLRWPIICNVALQPYSTRIVTF